MEYEVPVPSHFLGIVLAQILWSWKRQWPGLICVVQSLRPLPVYEWSLTDKHEIVRLTGENLFSIIRRLSQPQSFEGKLCFPLAFFEWQQTWVAFLGESHPFSSRNWWKALQRGHWWIRCFERSVTGSFEERWSYITYFFRANDTIPQNPERGITLDSYFMGNCDPPCLHFIFVKGYTPSHVFWRTVTMDLVWKICWL